MKVSIMFVAPEGKKIADGGKSKNLGFGGICFGERHVRKSLGGRGECTVTFNLGRALFSSEVRMF